MEIRVALATPQFDKDGEIIPPPLMVPELSPPKITQLVHMKLILTTLAKDRKTQVSKKRKEHKVRCLRICEHINTMMNVMSHGVIKNPVKRAAIVGNYC